MLYYLTHTACGLEDVLRGGCRLVQLRIKDCDDEVFAAEARAVGALCRRYGARFIVDDRVHLVRTAGADGVHLGRNDMPPARARQLLGRDAVIGATANTVDDIVRAAPYVDYIGLGPFRYTVTKRNLAPLLGAEGCRRVVEAARARGIDLPIVAIGGITVDDVPALRAAGVSGIAVSGAIFNASDKELITKKFIEKWKN